MRGHGKQLTEHTTAKYDRENEGKEGEKAGLIYE